MQARIEPSDIESLVADDQLRADDLDGRAAPERRQQLPERLGLVLGNALFAEYENLLTRKSLFAAGASTIIPSNVRDVGRGELVFDSLSVKTPARYLQERTS